VRIEIPKGGYVPTFSRHPDANEAAAPAPKAKLLARLRSSRGAVPALGGLALALVLLTVFLWRAETPTVEAEAGRPTPQARDPAIIVLPFEDLSEGSDKGADGVLAAGLTEELIAKLMRFGELWLYSAYGTFLEQPGADPVELSERLDVG
jgi:hypothetical protein